MKKLKIIGIDTYNYVFSDDNISFMKTVEFYSNYKPRINDILYVSDKLFGEDNLYTFGDISNVKNVKEEDIIKVVSGNSEYYLLRLYG